MKQLCFVISCVLVAACGNNGNAPEDANPDPCLACNGQATCDPTAATACVCPAGYAGDGTTAGTGCTDLDECAAGACAAGASCTNTDGGFTCACPAGYAGDGATAGTGCTDIDECATGANDCDSFGCENTAGSFQCTGLYAVEPYDGVLARLDPKTFGLLDLVQISSSATVGGITAMARHPQTGTLYAIANVSGVTGRAFGTLDLATAAFTMTSTLDRFSSLEFLPDGTLYGDTGAGAAVRRTLHTIDLTSGAVTVVGAFSGGSDGEVICYDPDAQLMYHFTGGGSATTMESFAMGAPQTTTNVSPGLAGIGEVFGCRYLGNHTFLVHDINSRVRLVTSTGDVSTPPDAVAALFQDVRATLPAVMTTPHTARPTAGSSAGGTTVTLRGIGLTGATAVQFGGVAAASFTVVDDTTITAVTPAVAASTVDVTVTTPLPYAATWPAAYTFSDSLLAASRHARTRAPTAAKPAASSTPAASHAAERKAQRGR